MKTLLYAFLIFTPFFGFSQITVTGTPPNRIPPIQTAKLHYDSVAKITYAYKYPKWYYQGVIVKATLPSDSSYSTSSGLVTISYQDYGCRWYNTTTQSYWDWTGSSFLNTKSLNLDSLLTTNNLWTGKNTYQDTAKFNKGIDSKGVRTTGSTNDPSVTLNGVVAEKDTVVATSFSLTGAYGVVGFDCSTGQKDANLPLSTTTKDWTFIIRKEDDTSNTLRIKDSTGAVIYTVLSRMTIIFKNKNGTWKRSQ